MQDSRLPDGKPESRALSAGGGPWQSRVAPLAATLALTLALTPAMPAAAAPGGTIGTMPIGDYTCELPGDASGPAARPRPEESFVIVTASSYRAGGTMGSYLLTGDQLTMTGGIHRGKRYHRLSEGFLRLIGPDGKDSDLRCVRRKRNNS